MLRPMRVRLGTPSALADLAAAIEGVGGSALVSGDTVKLVHPAGETAPYAQCELTFFVRAWAVAAERAQRARMAVEILS